ncbi:MAG: beta-glucosidase, partial [Myxococcota bacterium]
WDDLCERPGAVKDASSGAGACEHYERMTQDVGIIEDLGVDAYRFSIAWPRVVPDGLGRVNEPGLDFYDRLVDRLLEAGITPYPTLYHWDLPSGLQNEIGGWCGRDIVEHFVRYTSHVVDRLGDRVKHWATHNEPWCVAVLGHEVGEHAPGIRDRQKSFVAAHHVLLSHGRAVEVIRASVPDAQVGITLNLIPTTPARALPADQAAARLLDGRVNRWFLDPIFGRGYPKDVVADLGLDLASFQQEGDQKIIAEPLDWLGVNYYSRMVVAHNPLDSTRPRQIAAPADNRTDIGWELYPSGLTETLLRVHREYGPPSIFVTENGAAISTPPDGDRVPDLRRTSYLQSHLDATLTARAAGAPVDGYFVWSLMDNFEWAHGYTQRFGIVWVDYETQERTLKDSALWYQRLCNSRLTGPTS